MRKTVKNSEHLTTKTRKKCKPKIDHPIVAILFGLILFIIFDKKIPNGGEMFINLLLAFYAAQLSFFPHVFGILFLKKHPSTFWANASMIVGAVSGISIGIYAVISKPEWAWYPILICFGLSSIIYILGWFFSNGNLKDLLKSIPNIKDEKFSTVLMVVPALIILCGSIYCLSIKNDFHNGVRVWEIASYSITLLYTLWFWVCSTNGNKILISVTKSAPLLSVFTFGPLLFALLAITILHLYILNNSSFGEEYQPSITLLLISFVYVMFYMINKIIEKHYNPSDDNEVKLKKELIDTYNYIDKPTLFIFGLLFVYSLYVYATGNLKNMEIFFSGAIAFELLLSTYLWTRTTVA